MTTLRAHGKVHGVGILTALMLILSISVKVHAQGTAFDGYTLFNPNNGRTTYLIDMAGRTVHTWSHARSGGYSVYLLENGDLLRPAVTTTPSIRGAASSGLIQKIDWDGKAVWEYDYAGSSFVAHHDLEPMPNGNVLLIAWEVKSASEATASGRVNARDMWPDHIVEVKPEGRSGGSIVWEWHAWDHLVQDRDATKKNFGVVADHPELIDINLGGNSGGPFGGDWLHVNGISYNPVKDQIVISSHFLNEIYVIDHSTTTEEAAGHTGGLQGKGGDILYRWGSPQNYGISAPAYFDVVHCSYWIPEGLPGEGNILAFNNNDGGRASIIAEIVPPVDVNGNYIIQTGEAFGPAVPSWTYSNGSTFFSNHLGGNQRLPNGNTFITEATSGYLLEVDTEGNEVWNFNFGQQIARSLRYARDYSGLAALVGTDVEALLPEDLTLTALNYPNPFSNYTVLSYTTSSTEPLQLTVYDMLGQQVRNVELRNSAPGTHQTVWDGKDATGRRVTSGIYLYVLRTASSMVSGRMVVSGL